MRLETHLEVITSGRYAHAQSQKYSSIRNYKTNNSMVPKNEQTLKEFNDGEIKSRHEGPTGHKKKLVRIRISIKMDNDWPKNVIDKEKKNEERDK